MKIVIPGGSGQVGSILARAFHADGHEVVVLSRRARLKPWRVVRWDGVRHGAWGDEIDGADVVINLAGRSVNCRYNSANRAAIRQSRVLSTRAVGEAIAAARLPPRVWLQASTATIYAHRYDAANDERSGIIGGLELDAPGEWAFSIDVARAWEQVFADVIVPRTRKVVMRSAMTMSADAGGIFDHLLGVVRTRFGGRLGDGRQFLSWIHETDFVNAVRWLIAHDSVDGIVNLASPHPLPNAIFMRQLREAAGIGVGLPVTTLMLEIGAVFMRTESELALKSRRVVPGRLIEHDFAFRYPLWKEAAIDLYRRWVEARHATAA